MKRNNTGINILKSILPIAVICDHIGGTEPLLLWIQGTAGVWAVPCFMFLSFYLIANKLSTANISFVLQRIKRLYFPVLIWSTLFFLINLVLYEIPANIWKHLIVQLLTGWDSLIAPQMWFNINQIILLVLIAILVTFLRKKTMVVFSVLLILVLTVEYSSVITTYFVLKNDAIKYTFGRLIEMSSFAITGYLYGNLSLEIRKMWNRIIILVYICFTTILLSVNVVDINGLGYGGIKTYFVSVTICLLFINCRIKTNKTLDGLAGYSAGIYYIHYTIGRLIYSFVSIRFGEFNLNSLVFVGLVYVTSIIVLFPIKLLAKRVKFLTYLV